MSIINIHFFKWLQFLKFSHQTDVVVTLQKENQPNGKKKNPANQKTKKNQKPTNQKKNHTKKQKQKIHEENEMWNNPISRIWKISFASHFHFFYF